MKTKGKVYEYFKEKLENRKTVFLCAFCGQRYSNRNATRMTRHLLRNCNKSPEAVKMTIKKESALADITNRTRTSSTASNSACSLQPAPTDHNVVETFDAKSAQRALAQAIYVSGQPLALVEHPLWKQFFKLLNPDFSPPDRKTLSTTLLDEEYTKIKQQIDENIAKAKVLHIALDGWSNIRNEAIINIIVYTPTPNFYTFIPTGENRHTGEYLFNEMCKIIDEIGSEKVMLVITDNASNMVRCGVMLSEKYPNIKWSGCLAHTLNLIIGDTIKNEDVKKLLANVTAIIKSIQRSHIMTAEFQRLKQEKGINKSLQLPVKTRWGSHFYCIDSMIQCKLILQNMALNSTGLNQYKTFILDEEHTWQKLEQLHCTLKPVVEWITKLEGDRCAIHLVHTAFSEVQEALQKPAAVEVLGQSFSEELKLKLSERKSTTIKPIHLAATLLDPRNRGITLTSEEYLDAWEFILNSAENQNMQPSIASLTNLYKQVSDYKKGSGLWSKPFIWTAAETVSAVQWWETLFPETDLGTVAVRILTAPATSASVERSFSTFSNIHTKKRNRFTTDRAGKICLIAQNWKSDQMNNEEHDKSANPTSSTTDESHETTATEQQQETTAFQSGCSDLDDDFDEVNDMSDSEPDNSTLSSEESEGEVFVPMQMDQYQHDDDDENIDPLCF